MTNSLDWCQRCGARLELVDGTDPEIAQETQRWSESYRCAECGRAGTYNVDETGGVISQSFSGVCTDE